GGAAGQSLPVSPPGPPDGFAVGEGSEGGAALGIPHLPRRPQLLALPGLRVPQRVALVQEILADLADLPVQHTPCIPVDPFQLAPLAGMAALHRPPDLMQVRILLPLRG